MGGAVDTAYQADGAAARIPVDVSPADPGTDAGVDAVQALGGKSNG